MSLSLTYLTDIKNITDGENVDGSVKNRAPDNLLNNTNYLKNLVQVKGTDVASASEIDPGDGYYFDVTGTTTITSIATRGVGTYLKLHFADPGVTLQNDNTSFVLGHGNDIKATDRMVFGFVEESEGNWRLVDGYNMPSLFVGENDRRIYQGTSNINVMTIKATNPKADTLYLDAGTVHINNNDITGMDVSVRSATDIGGTSVVIGMESYSTTASETSELWLRRSNSNNRGTLTDTVDNQRLGGISIYGVNSSAWDLAAEIRFVQDGNISGNVPNRIEFYTSNGTNSPTLQWSINKEGYLGNFDNINQNVDSPEEVIHVIGSNPNDATIRIDRYDTATADTCYFVLRRSNSATLGVITETDDGDFLGELRWYGVSSLSVFERGAQIRVIQNGASGANNVPTDMVFYTSTNATIAEAMRIATDKTITFENLTFNGTDIASDGPLYITPTNDFTLNQNSVAVMTSVASGAAVNTIYMEAGRVGFGNTNPLDEIDLWGNIRFSNNNTNLVNKTATLGGSQNNSNAQPEGYTGISMFGNSNNNYIYVGGGDSDRNSATTIRFYTAVNRDIRTGTVRMSIGETGLVNIASLTASQDVQTDASKNLTSVSDMTWKYDLGSIKNSLNILSAIKPRYFKWRRDAEGNKFDPEEQPRLAGFFSQEVYNVFLEGSPGGANKDENGDHWGLNIRAITALNVQATNDLHVLVDDLREEIEILKAKM